MTPRTPRCRAAWARCCTPRSRTRRARAAAGASSPPCCCSATTRPRRGHERSGALRGPAVGIDAVLPEQAAQAVVLAVHLLVLLGKCPNVVDVGVPVPCYPHLGARPTDPAG